MLPFFEVLRSSCSERAPRCLNATHSCRSSFRGTTEATQPDRYQLTADERELRTLFLGKHTNVTRKHKREQHLKIKRRREQNNKLIGGGGPLGRPRSQHRHRHGHEHQHKRRRQQQHIKKTALNKHPQRKRLPDAAVCHHGRLAPLHPPEYRCVSSPLQPAHTPPLKRPPSKESAVIRQGLPLLIETQQSSGCCA